MLGGSWQGSLHPGPEGAGQHHVESPGPVAKRWLPWAASPDALGWGLFGDCWRCFWGFWRCFGMMDLFRDFGGFGMF